MDFVKLNPRLAALAELADSASRVADIGSDHALLPIALCQGNADRAALASDLREGPCARARANIAEYGLSERIEVRCCSGLRGIESFAPDCVIIAGMGGELIASILAESDYPRLSRCRLLLGPMSMQDALRRYLASAGFAITDERVVLDGGKYYQLLAASWDGATRTMDEAGYRLGDINLARAAELHGEVDMAWLSRVRESARRRVEGRASAAQPTTDDADEELLRRLDSVLYGR